MASTTSAQLLFSILIALCAVSVTARPCKTIFFITSNHPNSPRLALFITEVREFHHPMFSTNDRSIESSTNNVVSSKPFYSSSSSSSMVKTSIRERTMEIMSIVGALLFGVGCGALTAATMYLIWSLFSPRRFDFVADSDDELDDGTHTHTQKGYIAVPVAAKPVPPTADEVSAMK